MLSTSSILRRRGDKFLERLDSLDFPLDLSHHFAGIGNEVVAGDHDGRGHPDFRWIQRVVAENPEQVFPISAPVG